jgi:hypothetical protein
MDMIVKMEQPQPTQNLEPVTLDVLDSLVISASDAARLSNDINASASLWSGLELLYQQTRRAEQQVVPRPLENSIAVSWGNVPGVPLSALWQIACFFDWYSVSACNFVSLIGWIAKNCGTTSESDRDYRRRVIPIVLQHRNKIGAHSSRVWPRDDGPATQEASNFRQLALENDRFMANYMVLMRTTGAE